MKEIETTRFWGNFLILLGISGGAFVALIALMTWSRYLP